MGYVCDGQCPAGSFACCLLFFALIEFWGPQTSWWFLGLRTNNSHCSQAQLGKKRDTNSACRLGVLCVLVHNEPRNFRSFNFPGC